MVSKFFSQAHCKSCQLALRGKRSYVTTFRSWSCYHKESGSLLCSFAISCQLFASKNWSSRSCLYVSMNSVTMGNMADICMLDVSVNSVMMIGNWLELRMRLLFHYMLHYTVLVYILWDFHPKWACPEHFVHVACIPVTRNLLKFLDLPLIRHKLTLLS